MAAVKGSWRAVRKRSKHTRAYAKRTRPKTPAPKEGWVIGELSGFTGVPVRTLRNYVTQGLLRPLEFRGTATRYPRRELLRLLKFLQLKAESRRKLILSKVKRQLDALGEPELEASLSSQRLSPELAAALALGSRAPVAVERSSPFQARTEPSSPETTVETWRRIQLLPGLELMVSSKASPAARNVAERLHAEYVGSKR
jgi:DNA-binding transcriptional MerR regulator